MLGFLKSGNVSLTGRWSCAGLWLVLLFFMGHHTYGQSLTGAEYFWNSDPGTGNGINIPFSAGAEVDINISLPTGTLGLGFNSLNIRFKDNQGFWSHFGSRMFYIVPANDFVDAITITAAEYFFDDDPGIGQATNIPITPGPNQNFAIPIPSGGLVSGFHSLNIRLKDNKGQWSHFGSRTFYLHPVEIFPLATTLTAAEYFFNDDPGIGQGTPLSITPGAVQNNNFIIETTGVPPGFNTLLIRYRDDRGRWGHFAPRTFYAVPPGLLPASNLTRLEYFIDVNPDIDPDAIGSPLDIPELAAIDENLIIPLEGLTSGLHTLYIRVQDDLGIWSLPLAEEFTILNCTPPEPPVVPDVSRCNAGAVDLTAISGATGSQEYRWYADEVGTDILFTGAAFSTPQLSETTPYFVSVFDPATLCESSRTAVNAILNFSEKPAINPSGTLTFCEGNTVILSAPPGFSRYEWSGGQATQDILVSASGAYTVRVGDAQCLSPESDPVTVTIISAPPKPEVQVSGNTLICGSGTVVLTGPGGVTGYQWSNGATTQSIEVSEAGLFFLVVTTSSSSCPSLPSDPVIVTVLTPPCDGGGGPGSNQPPVIQPTTLSAQIEGRIEFDLTTIISDPDGNLDFSSIEVINDETFRGIPAFVDAGFFLNIDYAGNPFTGEDRVTIQACDLNLACAQQFLDIDVVGEVVVYNGLSPDGDGLNDFMLIRYIDVVEGASQNKVTIFNRWGAIVFDIDNYNNTDRVFAGLGNNGEELPTGTYFYKIEFQSLPKPLQGFITLIR